MSSVEKPAVGNNGRKSSNIPTKTESRSIVCPASSPSGGRLRARHPSQRNKKPGVLNSSSSQENVAPSSVKKLHPKSNMSYMELKRRHEGLMSEVQALGQQSKDMASQHQTEVNHLSEEIQFYKECNAASRQEISSCQAVIEERNRLLDGLHHQLEEIKFENERISVILEGARVDAITGERIEKAANFQAMEHENEFRLQEHEETFDDFISSLETMVIGLQEQKQTIIENSSRWTLSHQQ